MTFLTELIFQGERIKLGTLYDDTWLGQVYALQKWIYFGFIAIYM